LTSALQAGPYAEPALVPAMPWLAAAAPQKPNVTVSHGNSTQVTWTTSSTNTVQQWVVQYRTGERWQTEIHPSNTRTATLRSDHVGVVAVSAVNRAGLMSPPGIGTILR
jgi:hypothetical protein